MTVLNTHACTYMCDEIESKRENSQHTKRDEMRTRHAGFPRNEIPAKENTSGHTMYVLTPLVMYTANRNTHVECLPSSKSNMYTSNGIRRPPEFG